MEINANSVVGTRNILLITFDSLRFDVARASLLAGLTPNLARLLPGGRWEERRTQGSFTLPAHMAFFSGFLPVPSGPDRPMRLLACRAQRGTTIGERTFVFDAPNIVSGLAGLGYRTVCIGGVGFFSRETELGSVLPAMFQEAHWSHDTSPDCADSTRNQVDLAMATLREQPSHKRLFLFMNVSATHTPHFGYLAGSDSDSWESQCAALAYADGQLGQLFAALPGRGSWLVVMCSDHGDAFGEDGHRGHGIAHPAVWSVPYAEVLLPG
jgi:hypothetical protein